MPRARSRPRGRSRSRLPALVLAAAVAAVAALGIRSCRDETDPSVTPTTTTRPGTDAGVTTTVDEVNR